MSKRRMIDPSFWMSESVASLTIQQRYLFIGLFSNADDQGRLRGHPALVKNSIFPYDEIPHSQIESDLEAIEKVGAIIRYNAYGKDFIQLTGWWEYQNLQWAYPSDIPAPDGWNDRLRYRENNSVQTVNWNGELDDIDNNGQDDDLLPDNTPPKNGPDSTMAIGKILAKGLANPLPIATEIELVLDSIDEDESRTRAKIQVINLAWQNNLGISLSPIVSQEMNSPPYFDLPVLWWLESYKIAADNHAHKWTYVRGILDRSIQAKTSPMTLGPPKPNGVNRNGRKQVAKPTDDAIGQRATALFKSKGA